MSKQSEDLIIDVKAILEPFYPKPSADAIEPLVRQAIQETKVKQAHAMLNQYLTQQQAFSKLQIAGAVQALNQVRADAWFVDSLHEAPFEDRWQGVKQLWSLMPDEALIAAQAELEPMLDQYKKAMLTLQNFKALNKLNRDCLQPNIYKAIFFKVVAVLVETKVNAVLLSGLTSFGGNESVILAFVISLGNLGMGSLAGYFLQAIRHVDAPVRRKGLALAVSVFIVQGAFAYLMTLLIQRAMENSFDPEMALKALFLPGASFWELSLEPLRFLAITLVFGGIAATLVYTGQYADPYPGYSGVNKRLQQAQKALNQAFDSWKQKLEQPLNLTLPEVTAQLENLNSQYRLCRAETALVQSMVAELDALIKAHGEAFKAQAQSIQERANLLMAHRRGTYEPLLPPALVNPLHEDLQKLQANEQSLTVTVQRFKSELQAAQQTVEQKHLQTRRHYLTGLTQRIATIQQGDVDADYSIPEPPKNVINTHHWGGQN